MRSASFRMNILLIQGSSSSGFPLLCIGFFLTVIIITAPLSASNDTMYPEQSLSGSQTIISKEGKFGLGFFSPGNSRNFYIGIWYKNIPKQTVIWVANREKPLSKPSSAELKLSRDGNLVLLDHFKNLIWTSNSTRSVTNSTIAVLLDTGNLVLADLANSTLISWQSFDHPTNTYVPGSWVGMNKITGEYQTLTSWKNTEDPSPGYFSETIDRNGTSEFFLEWNQSEKYWRSGLWTGHYFAAVPILPEMKTHTIVTISYVDNKERRYTTCTYRDPSKITREIMDVNGQIKQLVWMDDAQDWVLFFSRPSSQCDVYSICGPFGVCDQKSLPVCSCAHGFSPASSSDWELNDWSSGCARNTKLECGNSISTTKEKDGFLVMPNMMLPSNPTYLEAYKLEEDCRSACLNDCSCNAYAHNGSGCLTWNKEPRNLQLLHERDGTAQTLYVRLAASDLPRSKHNHKILITVISVVTVIGILAILVVLLNIFLRFRQRRFITSAQAMEGSCVRFTYAELRHMTKDFSEKLGGGGFGSVFKGTLSDSIAIAVKKLEGVRQGEKQFRAEVRTLCTIQHINLIRLRGFCSEGDKKLLVYDFMQNGSLDSILFGSRKILSWKTRHEIITGIARGLAYLHEKCMECIIHCDIKPENILLDENFYPKVADFGMAKLIGRDISHVVTTMRGTIGYLAPEWISGMPISPKADVYSFGMMLFEIISGRRNSSHPEKLSFFPTWAATRVLEGEVLALLDDRLEGDAVMEELVTASRVACWCIQDDEAHRPSMGQVVQILDGVVEVNVAPVPRSLQDLIESKDAESDAYFTAPLTV